MPIDSNTVVKTIASMTMEIKSQLPVVKRNVTANATPTTTNPVKNLTKSATTTWKDVAATVTTAAVNTQEWFHNSQSRKLTKSATISKKVVAVSVICAAASTNKCKFFGTCWVGLNVVV